MKIAVISVIFVSLAAGCTVVPRIGNTYNKTPPQLIHAKARLTNGKESSVVIWDHPEYFGPVPSNLKTNAKKVCQSVLNTNPQLYKNIDRSRVDALGYHPLARNLQGKTLSGGGYYCNIASHLINYKHPKHRSY